MSVRHFPWLSPSGRRRWSSFVRQARAVPKRTRPSSLMFGGGISGKLVSVLTNPIPRDCQSFFPHPRQDDRALSIIGEALDRLGAQRRPALAFHDFTFALGLDEQIPRAGRHVLEAVHVDEMRSHIKKERLVIRVEGIEPLGLGDAPID